MRCETSRRRLLTAELEELRGEGDTPLARHLRSCRDCRRMAGRIVEMERELDGALEALVRASAAGGSLALSPDDGALEGPEPGARGTQAEPGDGATPIPGRAAGRTRASPGRERPGGGPASSVERPGLRATPWRVLVPLAAAAVAAVVLLPSGDEPTPARPGGAEGGTARSGPGGTEAEGSDVAAHASGEPDVHVQATGSERLVVFQPPDPTLTVVWFFGDDEDESPDTERN